MARLALFALASIESAAMHDFSVLPFVIGTLLMVSGISLRIQAIKTLGPMWTHHISIVVGHTLVRRGIYRCLKHPAYVGNIYVVGMLLLVGAYITSVVGLLFILTFYSLRVPSEERVLSFLEVT
jgi:isoprenylcysteine carboxyl methyltransferase (ICMT) family protein YpbQ